MDVEAGATGRKMEGVDQLFFSSQCRVVNHQDKSKEHQQSTSTNEPFAEEQPAIALLIELAS